MSCLSAAAFTGRLISAPRSSSFNHLPSSAARNQKKRSFFLQTPRSRRASDSAANYAASTTRTSFSLDLARVGCPLGRYCQQLVGSGARRNDEDVPGGETSSSRRARSLYVVSIVSSLAGFELRRGWSWSLGRWWREWRLCMGWCREGALRYCSMLRGNILF